jgi:hypothetical protein
MGEHTHAMGEHTHAMGEHTHAMGEHTIVRHFSLSSFHL